MPPEGTYDVKDDPENDEPTVAKPGALTNTLDVWTNNEDIHNLKIKKRVKDVIRISRVNAAAQRSSRFLQAGSGGAADSWTRSKKPKRKFSLATASAGLARRAKLKAAMHSYRRDSWAFWKRKLWYVPSLAASSWVRTRVRVVVVATQCTAAVVHVSHGPLP